MIKIQKKRAVMYGIVIIMWAAVVPPLLESGFGKGASFFSDLLTAPFAVCLARKQYSIRKKGVMEAIALAAAAILASFLLVRIPGVFAASSDAFGRIFALHPVLAAVSASVSGPAMEEIVFRLVPFSLIRSRNAALVVSSVLFAIAHAPSPLSALPYLAAGVIFGISYMRNGIAGSTISHSVYNILALLL